MVLSLPPLAAGNPLLPPVRPSLDFPELEVGTPLWPYDDLNIKGQYNRWPQIPGDIIPTASILIGPGDDKPHAAQFTKTRRLKVDAFISGGGGGGGGTPYDLLYNGSANVPNGGSTRLHLITDKIKTVHAVHYSMCITGAGPVTPQNQVLVNLVGVPSGFTSTALFAVVYPDAAPTGYQMQSQWNGFLSFPNGGFLLDFQDPADASIDVRCENSIGTPVWVYISLYGSL